MNIFHVHCAERESFRFVNINETHTVSSLDISNSTAVCYGWQEDITFRFIEQHVAENQCRVSLGQEYLVTMKMFFKDATASPNVNDSATVYYYGHV